LELGAVLQVSTAALSEYLHAVKSYVRQFWCEVVKRSQPMIDRQLAQMERDERRLEELKNQRLAEIGEERQRLISQKER
jgi:hypothetical protein